ncbi:hypothetical protein N5C38_24255 [Pseudomonas chengduensis]|nr:hypothetical protein [Pseudomonas chengduensis]MDH1214137.1 hypothetical protein [Pseudomonas chengduensis]
MNDYQILNLVSLSLGFISSICFAFGSLFIKARNVVEQTSRGWGTNKAEASAIVWQSAQYQVGSLLLSAYFLLAIAATQASSTSLTVQCLVHFSWIHIVLATLVLAGALAALLIFLIGKLRAREVRNYSNNVINKSRETHGK